MPSTRHMSGILRTATTAPLVPRLKSSLTNAVSNVTNARRQAGSPFSTRSLLPGSRHLLRSQPDRRFHKQHQQRSCLLCDPRNRDSRAGRHHTMGGLLLPVPRPLCKLHCFKHLHLPLLSPCRLRRRRSKPSKWPRLRSLRPSHPGRRQCNLLRRGMRPLGPLTGTTGLQPAMVRPRYTHPARSTAARPRRLPPCPP